jgi:peptidoglycan/xylan/chitin deacetylase (PgdA/CDA1 family)
LHRKLNRRKFLRSALQTLSAASVAPFLAASPLPASPRNAKTPPPQLALTMDDPRLNLESAMSWPDANSRILKAIASRNIRAALFVCGVRVADAAGPQLLSAWDRAGHLICSHTYSHLSYNDPATSYSDFAVDFLKNEKVIAPYHTRTSLFRYPFLKEGDTAEKRDLFRKLLRERGYRVGHVTIDASDWYIDQRYFDRLANTDALHPAPKLNAYRDFLINHLLDRATFYRQLAIDVTGRDVRHTLLVHYNALNALVLPDILAAFEQAGWQWIDASLAYEDPIFRSEPRIVPAGESLVWALAKESGKFNDRLRYPGEDSVYEKPKLDALSL